MLVSSCYVSRGMGVTKDSIFESDIQSHSRGLAMVPFDRPRTMTVEDSAFILRSLWTVSLPFGHT